jgi:hypothetical protein
VGELTELFPIIAGAALGLCVLRIAGAMLRRVVFVVGAIAIAVTAGLISGELAESAGFLLVDLPLTFLTAAAAITLGRRAARAAAG